MTGQELSCLNSCEFSKIWMMFDFSVGKTQGWSIESTDRHSYSWYKNPSESDTRPLAQTTTLKSEKTEDKDSYDAWSTVVGLGARSTSLFTEPKDPPSTLWASSYSHGNIQGKSSTETRLDEFAQGNLIFLSSHLKARTTRSLCSGHPTPERTADPAKANSLVELMGVEAHSVIALRKCCRTAGQKMLGKLQTEVGQETLQCYTRLVFPCLTSPSRTPWTAVWRSTQPAPQLLDQEMQ